MVFISNSTQQTQNLAKKLAKQLPQGSIISLVGDLGTGKTTFTKGFARQLGIKDHVTSPTFKLVSEYQTSNYTLYHIDAYRMDGPIDFLNIGGGEYLTSKNNDNRCLNDGFYLLKLMEMFIFLWIIFQIGLYCILS